MIGISATVFSDLIHGRRLLSFEVARNVHKVLDIPAEVEEETGLKVTNIHQIGAYSKVDRDPRGRTITVAYLAIVDEPIAVTGQDDAAKAEWFPLSALPELAFDHADIMQDAVKAYKAYLSQSFSN